MLNKQHQQMVGGMPGLCITIKDSCPEERLEWLIKAVSNGLRWYVACPDKRPDDDEHAIVLIDLLLVLQNQK